jgi:hypothetical protein
MLTSNGISSYQILAKNKWKAISFLEFEISSKPTTLQLFIKSWCLQINQVVKDNLMWRFIMNLITNGNEKVYNITKQPMTMALVHHTINYYQWQNFHDNFPNYPSLWRWYTTLQHHCLLKERLSKMSYSNNTQLANLHEKHQDTKSQNKLLGGTWNKHPHVLFTY